MPNATASLSNIAPIHPGVVLRDSVMPSTGYTVTAAAQALGITRQQLHRVLACESGISPEMALRLGRFCGNGYEAWIQMQVAYDIWHARQRLGAELDAIPEVEDLFELPDLDEEGDSGASAIQAHLR